jgi:hypothetical protein
MTFADLILDLAKSLAGFLGAASNQRRARKQGVGVLLERVSVCLATIAEKLGRGEEPVAECHELLYYSQAVPEALRKAAGLWNRKSAAALGAKLLAAVEVPSRAVFNLQKRALTIQRIYPANGVTDVTIEGEIRKIAEASGLFRAAAQMLRTVARL